MKRADALPECNWECLNFSFLASNHPHRCTSVSNRPHDLGLLLAPIPSPAAAVFLAIAAAMLAAVVEHPPADVLPHRVQPVEADGVEALDLDDAEASQAFDAQLLARDLAECPRRRRRRPTPGSGILCRVDRQLNSGEIGFF